MGGKRSKESIITVAHMNCSAAYCSLLIGMSIRRAKMEDSMFFFAIATLRDRTQACGTRWPPIKPGEIAKDQYRTLSLQPMLGLLSCNRYLPLRYCNGIVLEFTLASAEDALKTTSPSRHYAIEGAELRYSSVRLESALEAGVASLLMQNRSLSMNFKTMISQQASVPDGATEFSASVVRAISRCAAIFVSFHCKAADANHTLNFHNPSVLLVANKRFKLLYKLGERHGPSTNRSAAWPKFFPICARL